MGNAMARSAAPIEGKELRLRCGEIEKVATTAIADSLKQVMLEVQGRSKCYAFKSRFKGSNAIYSKVQRKRAEGLQMLREHDDDAAAIGLYGRELNSHPVFSRLRKRAEDLKSYNPDHVTDAWGCRFITLYQSQIPPTIEHFLLQLEQFNRLHPNDPVRMKEGVVYTNRPLNDPLSIVGQIKEIVGKIDLVKSVIGDSTFIRPPENRKSAYSSVHFVFQRDVVVDHAGRGETDETAAFEVQFRDIFEEGWGEVQHDLLYSDKDKISLVQERDKDSALWSPHLNALKTFVDGCSQHASIIKATVDAKRAPSTLSENSSRSVSARSDDQRAVSNTLSMHFPSQEHEVKAAVSDAYTLLLAGQDSTSTAALQCYADAALSFRRALDLIKPEHLDLRVRESDSKTVRYYLEIELGNCIFMTAEDQTSWPARPMAERVSAWKQSEEIFARIVELNPSDPTARLRLAKAVERISFDARSKEERNEECLIGLDRAETLLDECIERIDADPTTGPDHWLGISARVDKGVMHWKKSQVVGGHAEADLLELAVSQSLLAYQTWKSQNEPIKATELNKLNAHKSVSNALFYVSRLVKLAYTENYDARFLEEYIPIVMGMTVDNYTQFYKTRDNLMHAFEALGDWTSANNYAMETFRELRALAELNAGRPLDADKVGGHLLGSEKFCYEAARTLLFDERPLDDRSSRN